MSLNLQKTVVALSLRRHTSGCSQMRGMIHKKLFPIAALVIASTAFQFGAASAQTSGVGGDGYTRILWRGTDSSVSIWKVDGALNFSSYRAYGPYDCWTPIALTT